MVKPFSFIILLLGVVCARCSRSEITMTAKIQPNAKRDLVVKHSSIKPTGDRK